MDDKTKATVTQESEKKSPQVDRRITHDPYTFCKDCMLTNFTKNEILNRDDPAAPPSVWYALSVADGQGFQIKDVSGSKDMRPWELKVLKMYRFYFEVAQIPNKNGSGLRITLKIVDVEPID